MSRAYTKSHPSPPVHFLSLLAHLKVNNMTSYVEQLPLEVNGHQLRIKARPSSKKWCIRYIRKVTKNDKNIKDWRYRTEIQCWGDNLENTAKRMLKKIELYN